MSVARPSHAHAHRVARTARASMSTQSRTGGWGRRHAVCVFRHETPVFTFIHVSCRVGLMHAHMSRNTSSTRTTRTEFRRSLFVVFCFHAY